MKGDAIWPIITLFIVVLIILLILSTFIGFDKYIIQNPSKEGVQMNLFGIIADEKVIPVTALPIEVMNRVPVNTITIEEAYEPIMKKKYKHKRYRKPKNPFAKY